MQISVIVKKSFVIWILLFNLIIQTHLTLFFIYIYIYILSNYISTGAIAFVMPHDYNLSDGGLVAKSRLSLATHGL